MAKQAPLGSVLAEIADRTGVLVHGSVTPEPLVTANCSGDSIEQLVTCLFGSDAGFAVRYQGKGRREVRPAELWLLSADSVRDRENPSSRSDTGCRSANRAELVASTTPSSAMEARHSAGAQHTAELVELAKSKDSENRIDALSRLGIEGMPGDDLVRSALTSALADPVPDARAQAVAGLARLEGANAFPVLRDALRDGDASVRLMAVSYLGNDGDAAALLQQATADSDETVRALALRKLEALAAGGT